MSELAVKALMVPFDRGFLSLPAPGRGVFLRAEASPVLDAAWRETLACEQTFKPTVDQLRAAGFNVRSRLEGEFDLALCLTTRNKTETLVNFARAWSLLVPGGVLVAAGDKTIGAASLERELRRAFGSVDGLAKFHCRVFWTIKPAVTPSAPPEAWVEAGHLRPNVDGKYLTQPGVFSWTEVDRGSRLLLESLPSEIEGLVADLGAGWGYLSVELLKRHPGIVRVDLFEAEKLALDAAVANLETARAGPRAVCHWHDLTAGVPDTRRYDWIVMNPPFHRGEKGDIGLGLAFIAAAAAALRPGGWLAMVANRHLPYEADLERRFESVRTLADAGGYKVFLARR